MDDTRGAWGESKNPTKDRQLDSPWSQFFKFSPVVFSSVAAIPANALLVGAVLEKEGEGLGVQGQDFFWLFAMGRGSQFEKGVPSILSVKHYHILLEYHQHQG